MEAQQEAPETTQQELEVSVKYPQEATQTESEESSGPLEPAVQEQEQEEAEDSMPSDRGIDRAHFIHGLAAGIGIGCVATFVIMWIAVFFSPQLPSRVTYEAMLAVFIYPLIYLLAVGLVALTAGIVREYFPMRR